MGIALNSNDAPIMPVSLHESSTFSTQKKNDLDYSNKIAKLRDQLKSFCEYLTVIFKYCNVYIIIEKAYHGVIKFFNDKNNNTEISSQALPKTNCVDTSEKLKNDQALHVEHTKSSEQASLVQKIPEVNHDREQEKNIDSFETPALATPECQASKAPHNPSFLIVGPIGYGKSSVGNSILGNKHHFKANCDFPRTTVDYQFGTEVIDNYQITVLDTPDFSDLLCDDQFNEETFLHNLLEGAFNSPSSQAGFDAIVFILRFTYKYTHEVQKSIARYKKILGPDALRKHGVFVITEGDHFKTLTKGEITFDQWCKRQNDISASPLEECEYRCILFDNVTQDAAIQKNQRDQLLSYANKLRSNHSRYRREDLQKGIEAYRRSKALKKEHTTIITIKLKAIGLEYEINQSKKSGKFDLLAANSFNNQIDELIHDLDQIQADKEEQYKIHSNLETLRKSLHKKSKSYVNWSFTSEYQRAKSFVD